MKRTGLMIAAMFTFSMAFAQTSTPQQDTKINDQAQAHGQQVSDADHRTAVNAASGTNVSTIENKSNKPTTITTKTGTKITIKDSGSNKNHSSKKNTSAFKEADKTSK